MTAGILLVFGVFGLALASVAGTIQQRLPWFTVILGLILAALGCWLLAGRNVPGLRIATGRGPALTRSGAGWLGPGCDLEQPEIVVVRGSVRLHLMI
ncbi:hypothetical protein EV652_1306 [Kribbella steppae]|uniref:Uncharacterized protein n=1 Tax=Kribbella steppae TaxID=2512223 RepID=A0A4R2GS93_9ACTN|nr:hypothetical protein [Kribbella steppae]TCO12230.1 hypothetical protein EV652_1306 [Kribbella steppae]